MVLGETQNRSERTFVNVRHSSVALALVVVLVVLGTRFVGTGAGHEISAQAILFLFVMGALVGAMLGARSPRPRSGDE